MLNEQGYIANRSIAMSIFLAMRLGKPLLVEGPAGVGKTEIAKVMAKALDTRLIRLQCYEGLDATHALYEWNYQHQLLYLKMEEGKTTTTEALQENIFSDTFLLKRPILEAITQDKSPVLLIDEIDKAPREFPNDLLYALSHRRFVLPESGRTIEVSEDDMPAIVITSNREQELPTAFKGRCIYHYISFPEPELMRQIVGKHFSNIDEELLQRCIQLFYQFRQLGLERAPSTRDLLNWLKYLRNFEVDEAMAKLEAREGLGVLIKTQSDMIRVKRNSY